MTTFIMPTDTHRVTSHFRTSHRPNHNGVDFAGLGTHPIFAVAGGVIRRSYLSKSYGECVIIKHQIDGQVWESVYAHMQTGSRGVSGGQTVKQGQKIGIMGNTGQSTGQHLHFELHKGSWNIRKTNAVNPLDYLTKKEELSVSDRELLQRQIDELKKQLDNKLDKRPADDIPSPTHEQAWEWLKEEGITSGSRPRDFLTREQYAALTYRQRNR